MRVAENYVFVNSVTSCNQLYMLSFYIKYKTNVQSTLRKQRFARIKFLCLIFYFERFFILFCFKGLNLLIDTYLFLW
jgi:hypothetical protein